MVGEEDECHGAAPKYSLIPTPFPAAQTRLQCSSRPIASTKISRRPSWTKLPWGAFLNQGILQETKII